MVKFGHWKADLIISINHTIWQNFTFRNSSFKNILCNYMLEILPEELIWRVSAFILILKKFPLWVTILIHLYFSIIFWLTISFPDLVLQCPVIGNPLFFGTVSVSPYKLAMEYFYFLTSAAVVTAYLWRTIRFAKASSRQTEMKLALSGMYLIRNANASLLKNLMPGFPQHSLCWQSVSQRDGRVAEYQFTKPPKNPLTAVSE